VSADDAKTRKARLKDLATQERTLLTALRAAPSAAQGITHELEAVARERKEIERTLEVSPPHRQDRGAEAITEAAIKAFATAVGERLEALDVVQRQQLLSILGFQATVTKTVEVQARILVPAEVNPNHHCTNMGITT